MNNSRLDHHSLFEYVYAFAPIGIALVGVEGAFLKANPVLCRMLGYSEEEITARSYHDVTHPEDVTATTEMRENLLQDLASSVSLEKRYIRKNGRTLWASLHISLVRDEATGDPLYFISHVVDNSEKKHTEQLYKLISENAQEVIICSTMSGLCYYCSPSVRELLGYEPEEMIGRNGLDFVHPDDLSQMQKLDPMATHTLRYRTLHKNGDYIWIETTYKIVEDETGTPNVLAVGRDITERKKNEEMLAEAQKIAMIGSCDWDLVHHKISLSEQLYDILNIDKNASIRHPIDFVHFVHPNDQEDLKKNIQQALSQGKLNVEFRHIAPDGTIRHLHARGLIAPDEQGHPAIMTGTIQDITEHKQIELKLQESVERYTSLKKYNHDAVISLDLKGNIIHGNAVAERLTGYSISELAGQSAAKLIGRQHLLKILSESSQDATIDNYINRFMHRDGHEIEVLTTIAPIIMKNENAGFYIIAKDITEHKKLLIAKETAERTNKAKSEFLAMMSHEIRTPMNGVLGMADLLAEASNLGDDQKEYIEIIRKSGSLLLSIINDILDFSKIDSGKTVLSVQLFDIRDCVEETLSVLSAKALEKQLNMVATIDDDVPREVIGDPERLMQVLMNLVGNAIKFTDSGSVAVEVRQIGSKPGTVSLEFMVQDTGIGIPAHEIERLFEPFYQVSHSLNRNYDGTGLGLAICRKLVELMGGKIRAEPANGPGATFLFHIPFQSSRIHESTRTNKKEEPEAPPEVLNILVAEDNEINQKVISRMLAKLGHTVTLAIDGRDAVDQVANGSYDIVFMDVYMPVMDGLEATQIIRSRQSKDRTPIIIAMTANALIGDREKCLAAGMDEYISKPIKMDAVSKMIRRFR